VEMMASLWKKKALSPQIWRRVGMKQRNTEKNLNNAD
jgi:hypothetical protein